MTRLALAALVAALAFGSRLTAAPNVVVILSDDMGYSDLGCYGGEIATPNLDALAANGLRFTNFYNTARCCPTRASLLTGLYPHQAGVGHMMEDRGEKFPGYRGNLNTSCVTLAEALMASGDAEAATRTLREASDELDTRAATIADPKYRRSFVEQIPANVRIRRLTREWLDGRDSPGGA